LGSGAERIAYESQEPAGPAGGRVSAASMPKYRAVERQLRARVAELEDGTLLPTEARMCEE